MMMTDSSGICEKKSIGARPNPLAMNANNPLTGFMNMFFQTSAETVGITKNGAMTRMRTMPRPKNGWSSSRARRVPPPMVMISTPITSSSVLVIAGQNDGSVTKNS